MRILCVILGTISLAFSTHALVHYVPVGNKVAIPCVGYGESRTGKWLLRNEDNEFTSIFYEMSGYIFRNKKLTSRKTIIKNFALKISPFTELDKGTYVCQVCNSNKCSDGKPITLIPHFDISSTTLSTQFVQEDDQFSYSCHYNLTWKAEWRFEALGENTAISVNREFTKKNLLFILDVRPINAGKYSYWGETSTGEQKRLCSVTLCVLSVNGEKLTDSPENCTLYCDVNMDTDEEGLVVVGKNKRNISVAGRLNKLKSSLSCRLLRSTERTHTFSLQDATTTAQSYAISSITADNSSHFPVAALITTSTAFLFIVMLALFILLCVSRQRADRNSSGNANGHLEGEIESQVIYSTLQIGQYKQENVTKSDNECVYSQIMVSNSV